MMSYNLKGLENFNMSDRETMTIIMLMDMWISSLFPSKQTWFLRYKIVSMVKLMLTRKTYLQFDNDKLSLAKTRT